jgi:DNA polymerase V
MQTAVYQNESRSFLATANVDEIFKTQKQKVYRLPLFVNPKASPFNNQYFTCREGKLDLNEYLVTNPENTFLIRVTGNSMIKAGINTGDILVVDKSLKPSNNKIVVAAINDELLVKRLKISPEGTFLVSENDTFSPIEINGEDKFEIWGVVSSIIKTM